jgi:adenosylhomocysteinase
MIQWLASFYSSIGSYLAGAFMNTVSDLNNFVATRCAIADISLADFGRK